MTDRTTPEGEPRPSRMTAVTNTRDGRERPVAAKAIIPGSVGRRPERHGVLVRMLTGLLPARPHRSCPPLPDVTLPAREPGQPSPTEPPLDSTSTDLIPPPPTHRSTR